jgi:hypothetical protein
MSIKIIKLPSEREKKINSVQMGDAFFLFDDESIVVLGVDKSGTGSKWVLFNFKDCQIVPMDMPNIFEYLNKRGAMRIELEVGYKII